MPNFNHSNINHCEFYVCQGKGDSESHLQVPIDTSVQNALKEMFADTLQHIEKLTAEDGFEEYSPAQKYGATDAVLCELDSEFAQSPRHLLDITQGDVEETSNALSDLKNISYYYVIAVDNQGERMLGVRRASQFKGILKAKLMSFIDNSLKILEEETFRLDNKFDYLVYDEMLFALSPAGLEFTANLTEAVKAAAPVSAQEVMSRTSFLELTKLGEYASKHPRAARYLAAVKARNDLEDISQDLLVSYCSSNGVGFTEDNGKIIPDEGNEILFLEVLDRRIFTAELIPDKKERYEAPNRRGV